MPLRGDTYPPELMEAMRLAFRKACKALQLSDVDDAFTDIVATRIVEFAKTGERDPDRLCSQVLGRTVSVAMERDQ
jgi:hypothetical protein